MTKRLMVLTAVLLVATAAFASDEIVKRGEPINSGTKAVALADVIAKPADFAKEPVVVEGVVETVCQEKGCWMQISPEAGKSGIRVTFKNYGFFVPKDAKGLQARMEGTTVQKTLKKEQADHMAEEGVKLTRNTDGTASETTFVATGVELRKEE
ncbi:MAG: DUF4920 domain-containing protein [Thermoanaerobaculia bacterium]